MRKITESILSDEYAVILTKKRLRSQSEYEAAELGDDNAILHLANETYLGMTKGKKLNQCSRPFFLVGNLWCARVHKKERWSSKILDYMLDEI